VPSSPRKARNGIYDDPRLYDLAFSFRDVPAECDGLLALSSKHGVAKPRSVVEIACGPAHHLRELTRRGMRAHGVDLSAGMLAYAEELCARDALRVDLVRADMRTFALRPPVDLALCLFDSFAHCTTDADGIAALRATAAAMRKNAVMILEVAHPADYFDRDDRRTISRWAERDGGTSVRARYDVSRRDAIAETYVATLAIDASFRDGRPKRRIESRQLHRMWLKSSIANIAERSDAFDVVGWYGDLETRSPLSMKQDAWRMIAVLKRR